MRTALVIAIALGLCTGVAAATPRVTRYAYVTHVESSGVGARRNDCHLTAVLPATPLREVPSGDRPELLEHGTIIYGRDRDFDQRCPEWLHTWQRVRIDPDDPEHAEFLLPSPSFWTIEHGLIGFALVVVLWALVGARVMRPVRAWRRRRWRTPDDSDT